MAEIIENRARGAEGNLIKCQIEVGPRFRAASEKTTIDTFEHNGFQTDSEVQRHLYLRHL